MIKTNNNASPIIAAITSRVVSNSATHSELNAILNYRGGSLEGATIYVTLFPCNECAKAIIQSGIRRIVYDSDKYETTPAVVASKKMLNAAGVVLQRYEHTNRRIELEL